MNAKMLLSVFCGVLFASAAFVVCLLVVPELAFTLAIVAGAMMALLLHIVLVISEKQAKKRYAALERQIKSTVFYQTNGNFNLGNKMRNGNIYFCEEGIVFASFDEKPYACEKISNASIFKYEFDQTHMNIYTKEGRVFLITLPNAEAVLDELKKKNWIQ